MPTAAQEVQETEDEAVAGLKVEVTEIVRLSKEAYSMVMRAKRAARAPKLIPKPKSGHLRSKRDTFI